MKLYEIIDVISFYSINNLILGGDLNNVMAEDSRESRLIGSFMFDYKLTLCNDIIKPNCDYTSYHETLDLYSYVDYFMMSHHLTCKLTSLRMMDDVINISDHLPIELSCIMPWECLRNHLNMHTGNGNASRHSSHCNLRWDKAKLYDYYNACYSRLQPLLSKLDELCMLSHCTQFVKMGNLIQGPMLSNKTKAVKVIDNVYDCYEKALYKAFI